MRVWGQFNNQFNTEISDGGAGERVDVQPSEEVPATTGGQLGADESMKQVGTIVEELKKTMQEEEEERVLSDSIIVSKVNELNNELQQREAEGQNTIHRSPEVEGEPLSGQSPESKDDANDCASVESNCSESHKVDRSRKKREKRQGPMLRNK